jgi:RimJ/RimL family protein N-acetyltransferase
MNPMTRSRTSAPVLETERTILRPHKLDDFDAYCAMGTEPAVFRFIGGRARTPEAGWGFVADVHGKGIATEVVSRFLEWGDEVFGPARTVCIIDPENAASLNVAKKCGYREVLRTFYNEHDTILLERTGLD